MITVGLRGSACSSQRCFYTQHSERHRLPQQALLLQTAFGAWRKCLLRQVLGARQAGAGGGPCYNGRNRDRRERWPPIRIKREHCDDCLGCIRAILRCHAAKLPPGIGFGLRGLRWGRIGAWQKRLLRQGLGARQVGAGGGPYHCRPDCAFPLSGRHAADSLLAIRWLQEGEALPSWPLFGGVGFRRASLSGVVSSHRRFRSVSACHPRGNPVDGSPRARA
jgi:hypothetical protein